MRNFFHHRRQSSAGNEQRISTVTKLLDSSPVNWIKIPLESRGKWNFPLSLSLPLPLAPFPEKCESIALGGNIFSRVASDIRRRTRWKGRWEKEGKKKEGKGRREYRGDAGSGFQPGCATQHPVWITLNKRVSFRSCRWNRYLHSSAWTDFSSQYYPKISLIPTTWSTKRVAR